MLLPSLGLKPFAAEQKFFISSLTGSRTIADHVRNGARIEDSFARSLNHFYNPLTQSSLLGIPSPDWALEDKKDVSDQFSSFKNAREHFYRALTSSDTDESEKYFGLTFETLGNVIHHPQDMAQPQHVRDDEHCDIFPCKVIGRHNPSAYELYALNLRGALVVSGYPSIYSLPSPGPFTTTRSLWTTPDGKGIADYTNRGFVSAATNFRGTETNIQHVPGFPNPNGVGAVIEKRQITDTDLRGPKGPNQPLEGALYFIQTPVKDNLTGESVLSRTSTFSIFDADLMQTGQEAVFSLNEYNHKAASDLLTKRAVAYSAGLIDYFFRGKLGAEDVTFTDGGISLRVKNAIDSQKTPAWQNEVLYDKNSNGLASSFTVAFDYQDSAGKTQHGASNPVPVRTTDTLAPAQVSADVYNFTLTIPSEAKDVNYRLVFRGKLGQEEDSVAVGKVEPVSGFGVSPNYTPADGIGGTRAIFKRGGQWKLDERPNLVAGNIDWKGWYRNGRPTKVLSWSGPSIRYFPESRDWRRAAIYRDGEVFDYAPADVLAAAVARDTAGVEWVVAICQEGSEDVVYRRLSAKKEPPDPREQWQEIARLDASKDDADQGITTSKADITWFFNGTGSAAQTMRAWRVNNAPYRGERRKRLKITLDDTLTGARLDNLGNLDGFRETYTCSGGYDSHGAGSVQSSFRGEGSYIIAVDYKDDREVLAKVRLDATYTSSSTVTIVEISKDNYVQTGKTNIDRSWTEYFEWGGQEQTHYFDKKIYTASWSTASPARQDQVGTIDIRWKNYLYGLDLRDNVYAYTYWNVNHRNKWNTDGLDERTGTWVEGGEILSERHSPVMFFKPINFGSTTNMQPLGAIGCSQEQSSNRYGGLDFSATTSLGSIAVDTGGHIAASFFYRDVANNQIHGPVNYLSDGSLEETIPRASPSPEYHPIGVIY
jgi:hypothetical protein